MQNLVLLPVMQKKNGTLQDISAKIAGIFKNQKLEKLCYPKINYKIFVRFNAD